MSASLIAFVQVRDGTKTPATLRSGGWKTSSESVVNFVGNAEISITDVMRCASLCGLAVWVRRARANYPIILIKYENPLD